MIEPGSQFFCLNGDLPVGGPTTWHVIDWDQRRIISVTIDGEEEDDNIAIEHLRRHIDDIPAGVYRIYVSPSSEIISTYSDTKNDPTYCVHYPRLSEASLPKGVQTIKRYDLEELERLGPDVDVVRYPVSAASGGVKVVFKYYFMWQYAEKSWKEMNMWMRLPSHPNIVSFDRVVLDELEDRVVGFTNAYIHGETLERNKSRVFKLKWLQELTNAVDFLNFRCGIAHQDVAPRNLLVDETADSIKLFDFNFAARINSPSRDCREGYTEDRNDVKGVIFTAYEIITRDSSLRSRPHEDQRVDDLGGEWKQHPEVQLDRPMEDYRALLLNWKQQRGTKELSHDVIEWPPRPEPPTETVHEVDLRGNPFSYTTDGVYKMRNEILKSGEKALNWERPPQRLLGPQTRLLSTGKLIGG